MVSCPDSNSKQTVVTSLIANGVIFLVFIFAFILLRPKNERIYDSRVYSSAIPPQDKPRKLVEGMFLWIKDLLTRPDSEILRDAGLDGYLFLRYLRFLFYISVFGIVLLLPILLPVNATNGANCGGFDLLAYGNITNRNRYYAHVFLSWIFFGVTIFCIYRELLFYVGLRQAVLTSESEKHLLSNRTVLVNDVPEKYLDENQLRSIFSGVKHVFLSRDAKELQELVENREKLASRVEGTENSMIKKALKKRLKAEKKGKVSADTPALLSDYIKKPPTHRLGWWKIPYVGKKVETLPYAHEHIFEMSAEIEKLRDDYVNNDKRAAAFIVFNTQYDAEIAVQMLSFHRPLQMSPRFIGIRPDDVIWGNLSLRWFTRLPFSLLAGSFCTALVIFWAIPVAFAGFISQISHLIQLFPWLSFLHNLPTVLYGLISSLLPVIILSVLMMLLPIVIRKAARIAGAPTETHVEYYTQQVYFAFQVVQVFFVMSLSSSILAALNEILDDPSTILSLLQQNLPQASNIFIAYLLLQALTIPSGMLLQITGVVLYYLLGAILDNTPRKIWNRRNSIGGPGWGTVYPVYSNLAVIMLVYSIIAPLLMPFAAALFLFCYFAFLNNLMFCTAKTHNRGINYARALQHLFVGIYIAELILIVLFVFSKSWGPLVLEVIMGLVTVWIHVHLLDAFGPMLFALPRSLLDARGEYAFTGDRKVSVAGDSLAKTEDHVTASVAEDHITATVAEDPFVGGTWNDQESGLVDGNGTAGTAKYSGTFFDRLWRPHIYYSSDMLARELLTDNIWHEIPTLMSEEDEAKAFDDPSTTAGNPLVWFPEDPHGWADDQRTELRDNGINAFTAGAWYEVNEKKKKASIKITDDPATSPLYDPPVAF